MPAMIHANNNDNNKRKQTKPKFPEKLYKVLQKGNGQHAVTWLPHGGSFKIINEKEFMDVVAPKFFKQTKIKSFYKQLQLWGFERVPRGIDEGAWYNKYFIRGCPTKLKQIQRRTNSMKKSKAIHGLSSPTTRMPSLPSLISPTATTSNRQSSPSAVPPMYIMPMSMQAYTERPITSSQPSPTSNMVHMLPKQTQVTPQQQPMEITPTVVSDDRHQQPPVTQFEVVEELSDSDSLLSDNDDLFLDSIIKEEKKENVTNDVGEEDGDQMCNMKDDEFSSYILSVLGDDFDTTPQCTISNDDNHDKEFRIEPVDYMLGDGKFSGTGMYSKVIVEIDGYIRIRGRRFQQYTYGEYKRMYRKSM